MSPLLGRTDHAARTLPIASSATVRAHTAVLLRDHRGPLSKVLGWHVVAALVALVGPWVIGQVVQEVTTGERSLGRIDRLIALLVAAILVQTLLTWVARRASFVLSERIFARLREDFITSSVRLPLSVVERAGTGDLVARTTNDVESLAHIIRFGIPAIVVALTTVAATTVAAFLISPLAALSLLTAALVHVPSSRWYLKRAGDGYLWEHASYARLNGVASETIEGAQTMDALGLQEARGRRFQDALDECGDAERYTLGLRMRWFPWLEIGFFLPDRHRRAVGRLARLERPHHHRGRHRRHALRAAAARPARRAHLLARRDPVRRNVVGAHPRASRRCRPTGWRPGLSPRASRSTSTTCATPTARVATCCTASRSGWCPVSGSPSWGRPGPASRPWGA